MIITVKHDSNDSFIEANCNFLYYSLMLYWFCVPSGANRNEGGFRNFLKGFAESLNLGIWVYPATDSTFLKINIPDRAYTFLQIKYSEFNKMPRIRELDDFVPLDDYDY